MLHTRPAISIVVPTKNAGCFVEDLLNAVFKQDYPNIQECIFIDSDSQDETWNIVLRLAEKAVFPVRIYTCTSGLSNSRKMGVEKAMGEYVAFIDGDCVPKSIWLTEMWKTLSKWRTSNSQFVGVGGSNIAPKQSSSTQKTISLLKDSFLGSHNSVYGRVFSHEMEVDHIATVNALFLRKVLLLDIYDASLHFSGEDLFMSQVLRHSGYRFVYCPEATVDHALRATYADWVVNMYKYGRGRMLVMQKLPFLFLQKPLYFGPLALVIYAGVLPITFFIPYALLPLCVYFISIFLLSVHLCWKHRELTLLPRLLLFFVSTHIAYGVGELWQLLHLKTYQAHEITN